MVAGVYPVAIIKIKPAGMLIPRGPDHTLAPIEKLVEAKRADIEALARSIAARAPQIEPVVAALGGGHFSGADALVHYALVADLKPKRIIEIGSGGSTHIARKSIIDAGLTTTVTCIDPAPRADITAVADRIELKSVLEADPAIFKDLAAGDILFIDGSHYAFNGSDVVYLFLEIIPSLPPGVIVHIHDIMLPHEYVEEFSARHYNEQYVLAPLLLGGLIEPLLPVYWAHRQGWLGMGGSFWGRIPLARA